LIFILKEEHGLRTFENKVLRKIDLFETEKEEATEG
jgi:hypothetical protein